MAKIIAPNEQYTGLSASVGFINGVAGTDNVVLIKWFRDHGYEVIEDAAEVIPDDGKVEDDSSKELKDMTVEELTAYAKEKGIDIGKSTSHEGILKKIQDAEAIKE